MVIGDTWVANSLSTDASSYISYMALVYAMLILSIVLLIHSRNINYLKRYNLVRFCTEAGAMILILSSCLLIADKMMSSGSYQEREMILIDLFFCGIVTTLLRLLDSYTFYSRLKAVIKLKRRAKVTIHIFVLLVSVCSWLPFYTIVPFLYDTNSEYLMNWKLIADIIWILGNISLYTVLSAPLIIHFFNGQRRLFSNCGFTFLPVFADRRTSICFESCAHYTTSVLATIGYSVSRNIVGVLICDLITILALHFIFNNAHTYCQPVDIKKNSEEAQVSNDIGTLHKIFYNFQFSASLQNKMIPYFDFHIFFHFHPLSLSLSLSPSFYLSSSLSLSLSIFLFLCPSLSLSLFLSFSLSVSLILSLCFSLPLSLSISFSVSLSVFLSPCLLQLTRRLLTRILSQSYLLASQLQ